MFKMGCSMARKILAIDGKGSSSSSSAAGSDNNNPSSSKKSKDKQSKENEPAGGSSSNKTKSSGDELNDFSKLEADPRIPLNVRQIFKITKSWKAIARTMSKTGTAMFLNLFEQNEDLFYLFDRFQHLKGKELHDSMELREHAATVMSTLDQSINSLSDYDNFVTYLHSIGKLHRKVPGFKREHFWKIEQPFLKAVKQTLDERCNETIEEIYKIAIKLIIETIAEGYGEDDNSTQQESSSSKPKEPPREQNDNNDDNNAGASKENKQNGGNTTGSKTNSNSNQQQQQGKSGGRKVTSEAEGSAIEEEEEEEEGIHDNNNNKRNQDGEEVCEKNKQQELAGTRKNVFENKEEGKEKYYKGSLKAIALLLGDALNNNNNNNSTTIAIIALRNFLKSAMKDLQKQRGPEVISSQSSSLQSCKKEGCKKAQSKKKSHNKTSWLRLSRQEEELNQKGGSFRCINKFQQQQQQQQEEEGSLITFEQLPRENKNKCRFDKEQGTTHCPHFDADSICSKKDDSVTSNTKTTTATCDDEGINVDQNSNLLAFNRDEEAVTNFEQERSLNLNWKTFLNPITTPTEDSIFYELKKEKTR